MEIPISAVASGKSKCAACVVQTYSRRRAVLAAQTSSRAASAARTAIGQGAAGAHLAVKAAGAGERAVQQLWQVSGCHHNDAAVPGEVGWSGRDVRSVRGGLMEHAWVAALSLVLSCRQLQAGQLAYALLLPRGNMTSRELQPSTQEQPTPPVLLKAVHVGQQLVERLTAAAAALPVGALAACRGWEKWGWLGAPTTTQARARSLKLLHGGAGLRAHMLTQRGKHTAACGGGLRQAALVQPSRAPMASISSMKMMQGALRLAAANRERTRRDPTPTNISSNSEPALRRGTGGGHGVRVPVSRERQRSMRWSGGAAGSVCCLRPAFVPSNCNQPRARRAATQIQVPTSTQAHSLVEEGHPRLARHRPRQQRLARACQGNPRRNSNRSAAAMRSTRSSLQPGGTRRPCAEASNSAAACSHSLPGPAARPSKSSSPGGPVSSTPLGSLPPRRVNLSGFFRYSTISCAGCKEMGQLMEGAGDRWRSS